MEKPAAERLGEPVVCAALLQTAGTGRRVGMQAFAGQAGGVIGSAAAAAVGVLAGGATAAASVEALGGYQGLMFTALTPTRLGFFAVKQGLLRPSLKDTLAVIPREQVAALVLGGGALTVEVTLTLTDGTTVPLEAPRAHKGKAERLARTLAG